MCFLRHLTFSYVLFLFLMTRVFCGKGGFDMVSWGAAGLNFGGCKCDCDGKNGVQLMAIQKIVKVPKIKIHDFGKKGDWDIDGKIDNLDLGKQDLYLGDKYSMQVNEKLAGEDSGWELAGKYDVDKNDWNFDKSNMNFDFSFL